jgi:hypothetical protein
MHDVAAGLICLLVGFVSRRSHGWAARRSPPGGLRPLALCPGACICQTASSRPGLFGPAMPLLQPSRPLAATTAWQNMTQTCLFQDVGDRAAHDLLRLHLGRVHVVPGPIWAAHWVDRRRQVRVRGADARALEDTGDELEVLLLALLFGGNRGEGEEGLLGRFLDFARTRRLSPQRPPRRPFDALNDSNGHFIQFWMQHSRHRALGARATLKAHLPLLGGVLRLDERHLELLRGLVDTVARVFWFREGCGRVLPALAVWGPSTLPVLESRRRCSVARRGTALAGRPSCVRFHRPELFPSA